MTTNSTPSHNGRPIRILCTDSDPTAAWWIAYTDTPGTAGTDEDAFINPAEIRYS